MLKSIKCDKFQVEGKEVVFSSSLNVIKGDDNATNSIGKSTFLMLIDFVMGGKDFLKHNKDVVDELGHHSYFFTFEFSNEQYYFRRDTNNEDYIMVCNAQFETSETWELKTYHEFLKSKYEISHLGLSFRGLISLFIRVWGRTNLDVNQPLTTYSKISHADIVIFLLKLFNQYRDLEENQKEFKAIEADKKSLNEAFKSNVVKKIKKTEYNKNIKLIKSLENELDDISNKLALHTFNIQSVLGDDLFSLKNEKDLFLKEKQRLRARIYRVKKSIKESEYFESSEYESLIEYFPNLNKERIDEVENFHRGVSDFLLSDIKINLKELKESLELIEKEILRIDDLIRLNLNKFSIDIPKAILNKVLNISQEKTSLQRENHFYDKAKNLQTSSKTAKITYEENRDLKIAEIVTSINDTLRLLTNNIYDKERKSPLLKFSSSSYSYELFRDTGTGKAYTSLLLFDWAIFKLTNIPFLVHDSLLFKNIENDAILKMLQTYCSFEKQSFISIDDIKKYGDEAISIIAENTALELSNTEMLYIKDWRKN